jgi:hypothetical protein
MLLARTWSSATARRRSTRRALACGDLARTLVQLLVEQVEPQRCGSSWRRSGTDLVAASGRTSLRR